MAVGHLVHLAQLRRLRSLNLSRSRTVNDECMKAISHLSALENLSVVGYGRVYVAEMNSASISEDKGQTDVCVCGRVRRVCARSPFRAPQKLVNQLPVCRLLKLVFAFPGLSCPRVTVKGLACLQFMTSLRRLKVQASPNLSAVWFARMMPNVRVEMYGSAVATFRSQPQEPVSDVEDTQDEYFSDTE
jgi:hypothetical protein